MSNHSDIKATNPRLDFLNTNFPYVARGSEEERDKGRKERGEKEERENKLCADVLFKIINI